MQFKKEHSFRLQIEQIEVNESILSRREDPFRRMFCILQCLNKLLIITGHDCPDTPFHSLHTYSRDKLKDCLSGEFKYDMGWQKGGSGQCYDSRSGVGITIGNLKGKICAYDVHSKSCRKCDYHKAKGSVVPDHKCSRNWTGSSKAMEPDIAGELVQEIEKENVDVGVLIMEDDCTTLARVHKDQSHTVDKWSNQNHTVKHIGNSLYVLQKKA